MVLSKTERVMMRLAPGWYKKLQRAAALESKRRGALVRGSTLIRELAEPGIEQILADAK